LQRDAYAEDPHEIPPADFGIATSGVVLSTLREGADVGCPRRRFYVWVFSSPFTERVGGADIRLFLRLSLVRSAGPLRKPFNSQSLFLT
jgi:hypothetical protein